ncbi:hypothetical protein [Synoicihabitans lomoniglobus]|uniref:Uncharacterized protein n=1 Tax=Synoicihabitans lomoniglobus TaxID=2909285 RepID=A0AAE9ZU53_9BACT|nr:hypothetical protein [Opitutaceae bacterium LMO-M01]WED63326.1 hypothetical protein PXH66_13390 [Opitutaceae bacterium LMO-M01]
MTIAWSLLVPGALLLLIPANSFLSTVVQLRTFDSFNNLDSRRHHRPWWWVPSLWLDPARGYLGALLVKISLTLTSDLWAYVPKPDYALLMVVLGLGIISQLYTRREEHVLLAPIGFVAGMLFALLTWPVALVGLIAGVTGLFAFRSFAAFFVTALVGVAGLGLLLGERPLWLVPAVVVCGLPIIASLITGSTLELPTRDASNKHGKMG